MEEKQNDIGLDVATTTELKETNDTIRWEKLKELFILTYNQSLALDKQIDVIENQFGSIIEQDEKLTKEFLGIKKIKDDHRLEIIDIYKLHTDGKDKPYDEFEKYRYLTGVIKNTDEKSLEAYLAIVSAYTALEDRLTKIMPITIGHIVSLLSEYVVNNDIELNKDQQSVFDAVKKLGESDGK